MQQSQAPLFELLVEMANQKLASFHVPGHKSGQGSLPDSEAWYSAIMKLDMTEITGLDDLHEPAGVIMKAQQLAADCFGAQHTFFLVGGSTAGNMAMITSLCARGDLLIVQRDVHKSVLHSLMLVGARAVFVHPHVDKQSGLSIGVSAEAVDLALRKYPEAKGVLLTNPNYYGISSDIERIAKVVHQYDKPLLIDEAHGAHFGFHPRVPRSAMQCGADAAVQSAHKMLNALTMGALLHVQGAYLNISHLQSMLGIVQSSSPSYPIMASLDLARRDMALNSVERIDAAVSIVDAVRSELLKHPWLGTVEPSALYELDPLKLPIYDRTGTLSGYALQQQLESLGCMIEMADPRYVLLVFSPYSSMADGMRLIDAFKQISNTFVLNKQEPALKTANTYMIQSAQFISEPIQFHLPIHSSRGAVPLPLEQCEGAICADMIIPYPPGIPLLLPGETITSTVVDVLRILKQTNAKVQGLSDPSLQTLRVYTQ